MFCSFPLSSGVVPNNRTVAEKWLSARALGKDVFNFVITRKNSAAGADADRDGDGDSPEEPVVGIMGCYNLPEIGYLIHPGEFPRLGLIPFSYSLLSSTYLTVCRRC